MSNTHGESECCGAPVYDPGNTGEGLCTECHEHTNCIAEEED